MRPATSTCDACSAVVGLHDTRCPSCGRVFDAVRCPRCDFRGPPGAFSRGCPSCGYLAPVVPRRRSLFAPVMTVLVVLLVAAGALAWWVRG